MNEAALALLPANSSRARLPANYEAAKQALIRCEQIDECKEWLNKAAAVEVYARQAKDDTLVIAAQRIQARAIRRCGELLKAIPHLRGVSARGNELTRTKVAREAGLTRLERERAARVARIPTKEFEQLVESKKPPKVRALAAIGTRKYAPGRPKGGAIGSLRRLVEKCEQSVREKTAELAAAQDELNKARERLASYLERQERAA